MKKLLSIFLLVSLLFQASFAMALTYCQHEEGSATQHIGHHQHQCKMSAENNGKNETKNIDQDCGVCHSSCFNVLLPSPQKLHSPDNGLTIHAENTHYLSYISDSLERPSWSSRIV